MPHQVIDQHRAPAHSQTLPHELCQLLRIQMMGKKAATYQIESTIAERQGKRIAYNGAMTRISFGRIFHGQMRLRPIQQRYVQRDSALCQSPRDQFRQFAQTRCDFQQREAAHPSGFGHTLHHFLRGGDPAEPAVHPADIPH